ncbi:MAG: hypothetical protein PHN39_01425 [Candidatus Pacebacteria bacterium]|nr:hypothetical protein [Candidatus Paceibacterota bacterium]
MQKETKQCPTYAEAPAGRQNCKKICQNCKSEFAIEPEDFDFYEKIKVPPPTWCPECRLIRRMTWRNERALYKKESDLSGKEMVCLYSPDKPFRVYEQGEWWSDKWEAGVYSREYDFSKPFFAQFHVLQEKVPRIPIFNLQCTDSTYANQAYQSKNLYLCFSVVPSEDCSYCTNINAVKNGLDLLFVFKSEMVYECIDTERCHNSIFLSNSEDCINSAFLYDCRNCQDCIGGVGLRNQKYVFWGEQLSREEYERRKKEFDLASFVKQLGGKEKFEQLILVKPHRASRFRNCVNSTGDFLRDCKNTHNCFAAHNLENCRHSARLYGCKDISDNYGLGKGELAYETVGNEEIYNVKFCNVVDPSRNLAYCDLCFSCADCFGCVGLRNKQYCILNKQYSKEEYGQLVPKIIEHMNDMPYIDKKGRVYKYGEFFPPELSPFCYNETIAQEYFPLTKEEAIEKGYAWRDPEERSYQITMKTADIPDNIKDVNDPILNEVIECEHKGACNEQCTTAFRIIPQELQFYKKMNLPLPRLCPNCRHYGRLKQRNPLKLWKRQCQCHGTHSSNNLYQNTTTHNHGTNPCLNTFQTSYSPDRPEIVYCEECYLKEVV